MLSFAYVVTKPKIEAQRLGEEAASLKEVLPSAHTFEPVEKDGEIFYYNSFNKEGRLVGYVFKAVGNGYSSVIETMVGLKEDGTIARIKILSQNETPGLGSKIVEVEQGESESWFQKQFQSKKAENLDKEIQTITGATISSEAVMVSIQQEAKKVLESIR